MVFCSKVWKRFFWDFSVCRFRILVESAVLSIFDCFVFARKMKSGGVKNEPLSGKPRDKKTLFNEDY